MYQDYDKLFNIFDNMYKMLHNKRLIKLFEFIIFKSNRYNGASLISGLLTELIGNGIYKDIYEIKNKFENDINYISSIIFKLHIKYKHKLLVSIFNQVGEVKENIVKCVFMDDIQYIIILNNNINLKLLNKYFICCYYINRKKRLQND